jgi:TPR repeat protein
MPRYHRIELALFGLALAAIVVALVFAGHSWHGRQQPPSTAAVDQGVAALRARDYSEAHRFFISAAKAGDAQGQIWLADMMANGLGQPVDGNGAVYWLSRAANSGSAEAAQRLGELYRDGTVVLQDLDQARTWLKRAADQGNRTAARDLGELYAKGLGVKKDLVTAYQWLNLAASDGDIAAARARDRVAAQLAPDELREGQDRAEATLAALSKKDEAPASRIASSTPQAPSVAGG